MPCSGRAWRAGRLSCSSTAGAFYGLMQDLKMGSVQVWVCVAVAFTASISYTPLDFYLLCSCGRLMAWRVLARDLCAAVGGLLRPEVG